LEARLREFLGWMARFPVPLGIKEAVAARGLKVGPPAVPPACETQRELEEFRSWFRPWLAIIRKEVS
jgi:dihydrodipicolinate synthase/N-acetylneuraminate lyase